MEKEKNRSEISEQFKWDIKKMFSNKDEINDCIESVKEIVLNLVKYKGKIMESGTSLYNMYHILNDYNRKIINLYVYSHMLCDSDTKNVENQSLKMQIDKFYEDTSEKLSFILPEMLEYDFDYVLKLINEEPKLELYKFDLEKTYRYKKHTLKAELEELITKANNAFGGCAEVFYNLDNSDINLGKIMDEDGNLVELTNSNYIKFMNSKNRSVRENAFNNMYKYWASIKNTVASSYKGQIKENFFNSSVKKYDSPLQMSLYADAIDESVYHNLIDTVHKNMNLMYDYVDLRKKILGVDQLHMWDVYVDLCDNIDSNIPFSCGKEILFEALAPLGEDYLNDLKKAFDERWIDLYPNVGKKSGAYSWGTYDSYPYVLLNYNNTVDSVSTMAHELGHSMHSYYSRKNQDYIYHDYPIFLAEIASTVNEILLNDYMYKNASTKEEKILYLNEFLDKIKGTLFRQTMFAEFEMIMHDKYQNNIPLTDEEFNKTYYELNKLYFGDNMVSDELISHEWKRIPHFYTSFYVYKYATGISAAIAIASDILNNVSGSREKYLEFLSSGCSDYPLNILKKCGVDMTTSEPIEKALEMFNQKLIALKELI